VSQGSTGRMGSAPWETEERLNEQQATAQLAQLLADYARGDCKDLPGALRVLADQLTGNGKAPAPVAGDAATREAIDRVFVHWQKRSGHLRARKTKERIKAIRARLRDGYAEADLIKAIDGNAGSEFHREGGHDDLILICRNGSMVEKFCALVSHELGSGGPQLELEGVEKLKQEMRAARDEGRTADYDAANEKLRQAIRGDRA